MSDNQSAAVFEQQSVVSELAATDQVRSRGLMKRAVAGLAVAVASLGVAEFGSTAEARTVCTVFNQGVPAPESCHEVPDAPQPPGANPEPAPDPAPAPAPETPQPHNPAPSGGGGGGSSEAPSGQSHNSDSNDSGQGEGSSSSSSNQPPSLTWEQRIQQNCEGQTGDAVTADALKAAYNPDGETEQAKGSHRLEYVVRYCGVEFPVDVDGDGDVDASDVVPGTSRGESNFDQFLSDEVVIFGGSTNDMTPNPAQLDIYNNDALADWQALFPPAVETTTTSVAAIITVAPSTTTAAPTTEVAPVTTAATTEATLPSTEPAGTTESSTPTSSAGTPESTVSAGTTGSSAGFRAAA